MVMRRDAPGATRTVCIITGTRAEFGLLRPVMHAVRKHRRLRLQVVAAGAHFLPPARTIREVEAEFPVAARIRMQQPGKAGRLADARATARGIDGFARAFARLRPDWVVVLGDRIEAFAAASAASIGGIAVCHIHGGDRAEGIADEAMRHAITKLAHLHCAATARSHRRIERMGERKDRVFVTGSPAIDGIARVRPLPERAYAEMGRPKVVILMHPAGPGDWWEACMANHAYCTAKAICAGMPGGTAVWLAPNADPGRDWIEDIRRDHAERASWLRLIEHLPRAEFVGLLKRLRASGGALVGNSSAGLIECAALGVPAINIGPRQNGRERGPNVLDVLCDTAYSDREDILDVLIRCTRRAQRHARATAARRAFDLFGDGRAGPRIAALLASTDPHEPALLRKRNTY